MLEATPIEFDENELNKLPAGELDMIEGDKFKLLERMAVDLEDKAEAVELTTRRVDRDDDTIFEPLEAM